jgi:hypothetical protein
MTTQVDHAAQEAHASSMSDSPPPKRRFWQIHLSTAVGLMVVAAVFIGMNATPWDLSWGSGLGFPMIYCYWAPDEAEIHFDREGVVTDLSLASVVVFLALVRMEYHARRRSKP